MGDIADMVNVGSRNGDDYHTRRNNSMTPQTCKHCGKYPLYWKQFDGKWRLSNGTTEHKCFSSYFNS